MKTYYDTAPEHNVEMNARGFRNLLIGIFILIIALVIAIVAVHLARKHADKLDSFTIEPQITYYENL